MPLLNFIIFTYPKIMFLDFFSMVYKQKAFLGPWVTPGVAHFRREVGNSLSSPLPHHVLRERLPSLSRARALSFPPAADYFENNLPRVLMGPEPQPACTRPVSLLQRSGPLPRTSLRFPGALSPPYVHLPWQESSLPPALSRIPVSMAAPWSESSRCRDRPAQGSAA